MGFSELNVKFMIKLLQDRIYRLSLGPGMDYICGILQLVHYNGGKLQKVDKCKPGKNCLPLTLKGM